ncbi:MAG: rod shape-determining protein MreD [Bacteroidales bacterium]|nr:rod shape-determining protein MreD [Bacteroidales bacterium]
MSSIILRNTLRFVILVLLQVLILDHVHLGGYVNPYLYVYFILLLPLEIPGWLLLAVSFLAGWMIDLFSHTPGMHAAASVFMAFCRPLVLRSISSRTEYEPGIRPTIHDLGFRWFFSYSLILIFAHHLVLFYLEVFRFSGFFLTLQRTLLSVLLTLILVILAQYLFSKPSR